MSVCQLVGPPLWSSLKYLNNYWMHWHEMWCWYSSSPDDDFDDSLNFPLVPPSSHLWFWVTNTVKIAMKFSHVPFWIVITLTYLVSDCLIIWSMIKYSQKQWHSHQSQLLCFVLSHVSMLTRSTKMVNSTPAKHDSIVNFDCWLFNECFMLQINALDLKPNSQWC